MKTFTGKTMFLGSSFALAATLLATPALADTTWTMVNGYPEHSFFTKNIHQFIDEIESRTNGKLKIKLYSNGSLVKHDSIKRAVSTGQAQLGEVRLAVYSNEDAMYGLDNIPNLTDTYESAWQLMEAQRPYFDDIMAKQNMKTVAFVAWPGQGFYTKEKLNGLDDLKGVSIRMYSTETKRFADMMGMQATILPFADVPQALSTGLVSALWTSAQTGTDVQAWDYLKYYTYTESEHNKNAFLVNTKALAKLDAETQDIIMEAGRHATKRGWEMSKQATKETIQALADNGMIVEMDAPKDILDKMDEIGARLEAEWLENATPAQAAVLEAFHKVAKAQ